MTQPAFQKRSEQPSDFTQLQPLDSCIQLVRRACVWLLFVYEAGSVFGRKDAQSRIGCCVDRSVGSDYIFPFSSICGCSGFFCAHAVCFDLLL